jgi:D-threo-aldose 1-dehydrogenase
LLRPDPAGSGTLDLAHDFVVPADVRRVWDFSSSGIRQSLAESLDRLGLDAVDVVYLHDPEEFDLDVAVREGIPAAAGLRDEGLVAAIGVGSKSTDALVASVRTGALDLVMIAGRYTLLEQPAAIELLPLCEERGVGAVCAAVFNSGLLAKPRPTGSSRYEYGVVPAALLDRADRIADVCESYGVDLPTAALHFPFRNQAVGSVVVGGASAEQVRQNAARMTTEPPAELWAALSHNDLVTT